MRLLNRLARGLTTLAICLGCAAACTMTPASQAGGDTPASPAAARTNDAPRPAAGEEVFYHVFFRSFRDGNGDRIGDLRGMTEGLDYLKDLGITSLLLTPLQPSPFYHNYFATDFETIEPAYGTMDDYTAFIRAAHARGLKVYLDMEIQYVGEGHPWWAQSIGKPDAPFADYLLWRDKAQREAEPFLTQPKWEGYDRRWHGIAMVNMNSPAVRDYFQNVLLKWADPDGDGSGRDGPDGFRIDHMMDDLDNKKLATNLFDNFWKPVFDALRARRPEFRIMAEQYDWGYGADWLTRGNADMVFAFPLREAILKLDKGEVLKALRETARLTPAGKHQLVFIENHDTDRSLSLFKSDEAKARAAAAISLLVQGEPLIYSGQEIGMRGIARKGTLSDGAHVPLREAFRWKADLDAPGSATWYRDAKPLWEARYNRSNDGFSVEEEAARPDSLLNWYRQLLALRKQRSELRSGTQRFPCEDGGTVLCVLRQNGAAKTLLLANLGDKAAPPTLQPGLREVHWTDVAGKLGTARTKTEAIDPTQPLSPLGVRILSTQAAGATQ